ncbi:hypothetical protein [Actinopolyspora halophila]|uniref:hypothetical protein n=1 Tax=Actinopolyspora halophila TaxID=1850 RepID=UPI0003AB1D26|nr:hypothetical protein [Actinopolyspora halophila]
MPMFLGPLGGLQQITPLRDIDTDVSRVGGTHTALSGRRTVDYLGTTRTHTLAWKPLKPDELAFLEALQDRHIRGPLRLVWPAEQRRNRLSRSAASAGRGGWDLSRIEATGGSLSGASTWPADAPPLGRGLTWSSAEAGHALRLDRSHPAPVLDGETVTASIYVRSATADEVLLGLNHWTESGYDGASTGSTVTLTPDTWQRLTLTTTPGSGVWATSPAVQVMSTVNASTTLAVAATQLETGDTASAWQQGGGAPVVAVDTMPTTSPYSPYSTPELTLMEL